MSDSSLFNQATNQLGLTLIELVIFIMVVSLTLVGTLKVLEITGRNSSDPIIRKQALAIAESLLIEIERQPFTYCDPEDANVSTAIDVAGCATDTQDPAPTGAGAMIGPFPNTEDRYNSAASFDNVADYGGLIMPSAGCAGICNSGDSTPIAGLIGYTASVDITRVGAAAPFASLPKDAALKIDVTVTGPAGTNVTLTGYRVRYAPNI